MKLTACGLTAVILLSGCAGGRVYDNNIRHVCLCAVKTVRANGYAVKEQDFQESAGTLVAAFSVPDLKQTEMSGSLTKRAGAFIWNAWEHTKLDSGKGRGKRLRIEERVTVKFKATGGGLFSWIDWNSPSHTTVDLVADVTDYGKSDWVINREDRPKEYREALFTAITDCLAGRQVVAIAPQKRVEALVVVAEKPVMPVDTAKPVEKPVRTAGTHELPGGKVETAEPEKLGEAEIREMLASARGIYEAGNYAEAIKSLERVAKADTQNAEALGYLGASYHQVGMTAEAIAAYEQYMKLVPGDYRTAEFLEELKRK